MEKLKTILKRTFNITDKEYSDSLTQDDIANWDSLKHMELVVALEQEYDMVLEMEEILELKSIQSIKDILQKKGIKLGG
jgi:acyl carrier protein